MCRKCNLKLLKKKLYRFVGLSLRHQYNYTGTTLRLNPFLKFSKQHYSLKSLMDSKFTWPSESKPSIWLRSSISVLCISRSADVPSENLRPPKHMNINRISASFTWASSLWVECIEQTVSTRMNLINFIWQNTNPQHFWSGLSSLHQPM